MSKILSVCLLMSYLLYGPRMLCRTLADSLQGLQHGLTQFTGYVHHTQKTTPQCSNIAFLEDGEAKRHFTQDQLTMIPNYDRELPSSERRLFLTCFNAIGDIPIGLVSFGRGDDKIMWITALGIRKDYQKKGYGSLLMNHVFTLLKQEAEPVVLVNPTQASIKFYKDLGFVETGHKTSIWKKPLS